MCVCVLTSVSVLITLYPHKSDLENKVAYQTWTDTFFSLFCEWKLDWTVAATFSFLTLGNSLVSDSTV